MPITIAEFMNRITSTEAEIYILVCTDVIVYDRVSRIVYIPEVTHRNTNLNPMGDFRTPLGHELLWSRHVEIDCSSQELADAFISAGYDIKLFESTKDYIIYTARKSAPIGA